MALTGAGVNVVNAETAESERLNSNDGEAE